MRVYARDLINKFTDTSRGLILYGSSEDVQGFVVWLYQSFSNTLKALTSWEHTDGDNFFSNTSAYTANLFSVSSRKRFLLVHDVADSSRAVFDDLQNTALEPFIVFKGRNLKQTARLVKWGSDQKDWTTFACYDNVSLDLKKIFFQESLAWQGVRAQSSLMPLLWQEVPLALWPSVCEKLCILSTDGQVSLETYKTFSDVRAEEALFKEIVLMRHKDALRRFFITVDLSSLMISVRALTNLLFKMLSVKESLGTGQPSDRVWAKLTPPLFFEDAALCKKVIGKWTPSDLKRALMAMGQFEKRLKEKDPFCFDSLISLMAPR